MVPRLLKSFLSATEGATAIEYGLLAGLITVGLLGGLGALSGNLQTVLETINTALLDSWK
ncbi:Flp family type IVb pilin [Shinella sp. M27]|uniref:Flp family type IVb pilin n=1 Tax=Shinella sp. M27 TaxID=3368614 RepID=UPI003BA1E068